MTGMDGIQDGARAKHRSLTDSCPLDHHATTPDERSVFDDDRHGVSGLEDTPNTHASREVDVGADLGATTHGGPGVDHRSRPHPGADIDVAGHHDDARTEETAATRRRAGYHANTPSRVVSLQVQFVVEFERADFNGLAFRAVETGAESPA